MKNKNEIMLFKNEEFGEVSLLKRNQCRYPETADWASKNA